MRVLAVDIGTRNIGWAIDSPGSASPSHGVYHPPVTGRNLGWLLADIRSWLGPLIAQNTVTLIVYESPILYAQNNFLTIRKVASIGAGIELVAYDADLPCEEQLPGPVRKHFLSPHSVPRRTKEIKEAVIARCRQLGWRPQMDDDADAMALLDYTLSVKNSALYRKIGALL